RLELVRAHRLIGRLRDQDHLTEAERELTALSRDGAAELQNSLAYERAMIVLDTRRADDSDLDDAPLLAALQDLSAFTNIDPSPNRDQYIVARGPTQLARLAVFMGNRALNRRPQTVENTQLALRNFRDAVSAYGVLSELGGVVDRSEAADIRVRMGLINVRMASILGRAQQDTYGCASGADSYSISEAEANFAAARDLDPQSSDALWGLGCALMARNNFSASVDAFQQAVSLMGGQHRDRQLSPSDYYLGLARALAAQDQWDGPSGAVAYFNMALRSEDEPGRVGSIRLEIARIYARKERWAEARASLQDSINARPDAQAYLLLGKILYNHSDLEASSSLTAREALRSA